MTSYKEMNRLRKLRKLNKLTLKELSKTLEAGYDFRVSDSQIYSYETGKRKPRDERFWEYTADFFEVSTPYLMGYDQPEKSIADLKEKLVDAIKEIKQYRLLKVGLDDFIAEKDVLDVIGDIFS